jgi:hypothetical protein
VPAGIGVSAEVQFSQVTGLTSRNNEMENRDAVESLGKTTNSKRVMIFHILMNYLQPGL